MSKSKKPRAAGKSLMEKAFERVALNTISAFSRKGTQKLIARLEEKLAGAKTAAQTRKAPPPVEEDLQSDALVKNDAPEID